ncbi:MAG: tRNA lysidine(34) synthetase TilS [Holosporales bacterium]|jgi:tRNA(Ile)-lysidine synthase|nr:tRNA lysidine(34) synthetase TilS [Holosporales bacterium]
MPHMSSELEKKFASNMNRLLSTGDLCDVKGKVFVSALSGGPDSTSLAILADQWIHANGGKLFTVTVDHALRQESAEEAKTVGSWMKERNIDHRIIKWDHGAIPCGRKQVYARQARYDLIFDFCSEVGADYLLVAHTLDDQLETHLIRQESHSGDYGLAGMSASIKLPAGDVVLARPLLNVYKKELIEYLIAEGQKWVEDPSNLDQRYKRVRVRTALARNADKAAIFRRILELGRARQELDRLVNNFIEGLVEVNRFGYAIFPADKFHELSHQMQRRTMKRLLWSLGGKQYPASDDRLISTIEQMQRLPAGKKINFSGCLLAKRKDCFHIMRELRGIDNAKTAQKAFWDRRFFVPSGNISGIMRAGLEKAAKLRDFYENDSMLVEGFGSIPVTKKDRRPLLLNAAESDMAVFRPLVNLTDEFVYLS